MSLDYSRTETLRPTLELREERRDPCSRRCEGCYDEAIARDRFTRRVKDADEYKKILLEKFLQQCQDNFLLLLK